MPVRVIGGGPAGASAAIAARIEGAAVEIFEKSSFPRHKVCGEFLSPEIAGILDGLGVWPAFEALAPPRISRVHLAIERSEKRWPLPERAYGLSRFALDDLLLRHAIEKGAHVSRENCKNPNRGSPYATVIAHGRRASAPSGSRLFGFKAHFTGPASDAIDLFFFRGCYLGVSAIENGATNVCGLAPESLLRARNFEVESLFALSPLLAERLAPLTRAMQWLITGPLIYRDSFHAQTSPGEYLAGDALGFVDPFTGSGLLAAFTTGGMAGMAAARGLPVARHMLDCKKLLGSQYGTAALFRRAVSSGIAERLAPLVPGRLLFQWTRPAGYKKSR
ncbi:MAG: FAD-dependent monooxygenase [Acidobacteriota bacterium]|nr:FAD-dependent monooxygenase [Acidobacteriota bacterium]